MVCDDEVEATSMFIPSPLTFMGNQMICVLIDSSIDQKNLFSTLFEYFGPAMCNLLNYENLIKSRVTLNRINSIS